jgi:adenine/guanine phosphoribosyltransferase-like PRPP-binding protein
LGRASAEAGGTKNHEAHLVVNLMPFSFPSSVADKIIKGLRKCLESTPASRKAGVHITFLVRNAFVFQGSHFYQDTVEDPSYSVRFSLIDYRGYSCEGVSPVRKPVPRGTFHNVLAGDYDWFYRQLVYGTNAYIGHFVLPNSHVRTHYDLTDFVREDSVFEYLYQKINDVVGERSNVVVVFHGIERVALQRLGSQLVRHSNRFADAMDFQGELRVEDLSGADAVLVLTDIVNTGRSLREVYEKVCALRGSKEGVICYSVISMQNTASQVKFSSAAQVRRDFYAKDAGKCTLCQLGQPATEVVKAEDFRVVQPAQLTPYDFWEMVYDCKAMRRKEAEQTGRILAYRVETTEIIERYSHWLKTVLKERFDSALPKRVPTKILTVRERGGVAFSGLVCRALGLSTKVVLPVTRAELERLMLPNGQPAEPGLLAQERVLLVDDGINEGNTLRMLSNYCTKHGADPIGVAVLDSRLGEEEMQKLRYYIGRGPIVCLYQWPGKIIHYDAVKN